MIPREGCIRIENPLQREIPWTQKQTKGQHVVN